MTPSPKAVAGRPKMVVAIKAYDKGRGKQLNADVCDFLSNKILQNLRKIEAARKFVKAYPDTLVEINWDGYAPRIGGYTPVWWLTIESTRESVSSFVRTVDDDPNSECHELIGSFKVSLS